MGDEPELLPRHRASGTGVPALLVTRRRSHDATGGRIGCGEPHDRVGPWGWDRADSGRAGDPPEEGDRFGRIRRDQPPHRGQDRRDARETSRPAGPNEEKPGLVSSVPERWSLTPYSWPGDPGGPEPRRTGGRIGSWRTRLPTTYCCWPRWTPMGTSPFAPTSTSPTPVTRSSGSSAAREADHRPAARASAGEMRRPTSRRRGPCRTAGSAPGGPGTPCVDRFRRRRRGASAR